MDILKDRAVFGALHDSAERGDPPRCHPETRVALLDIITSWFDDHSSEAKRILWLSGAVGVGKSAIAQTMSERWSSSGSLAGTFYFSRTVAGRNQSMPLVPTLAYQIAEAFPTTRHYIETAISQDERLFTRTFKDQFMALIVRPLIAPYTLPLPLKVIVIDGLDECYCSYSYQDYEAQQQEILDAIWLLSESRVPVKILVSSRPERQIRSFLDDRPDYGRINLGRVPRIEEAWLSGLFSPEEKKHDTHAEGSVTPDLRPEDYDSSSASESSQSQRIMTQLSDIRMKSARDSVIDITVGEKHVHNHNEQAVSYPVTAAAVLTSGQAAFIAGRMTKMGKIEPPAPHMIQNIVLINSSGPQRVLYDISFSGLVALMLVLKHWLRRRAITGG